LLGFFTAETLANMILAINRCLDILLPETARTLFEGRRVWFWLFGISLYGGYWIFFVVSDNLFQFKFIPIIFSLRQYSMASILRIFSIHSWATKMN